MKLRDALFKEPCLAFQVKEEHLDNYDEFHDWELEPLMGPTLAKEYVRGPFEGLFIIAGKVVTEADAIQDCYLDIVLPERICEHRFLQVEGQITKSRGRRTGNGTAIPIIAIEKNGNPDLFYAKEDPNIGIEVLQKGLQQARNKRDIADDLGILLRKHKRYEEAIQTFTVLLKEAPPDDAIVLSIHQERCLLYAALGQHSKAEEEKRLWANAFAKRVGRPPMDKECFWN